MLIFPKITKAGVAGIGGKRGKGVLRQGDKSLAYYRTTSVSFGAELGFETHGYVIMFMTHNAAQAFVANHKVNLGAQAEIAVYRGIAAEATTQSMKSEIIAFIFNEKGAILDLTLEGTYINQMHI
ncbi:MAG: lipid-binding SYLF domain-containing protein [Paracoccaceae bacterium]